MLPPALTRIPVHFTVRGATIAELQIAALAHLEKLIGGPDLAYTIIGFTVKIQPQHIGTVPPWTCAVEAVVHPPEPVRADADVDSTAVAAPAPEDPVPDLIRAVPDGYAWPPTMASADGLAADIARALGLDGVDVEIGGITPRGDSTELTVTLQCPAVDDPRPGDLRYGIRVTYAHGGDEEFWYVTAGERDIAALDYPAATGCTVLRLGPLGGHP